jgi:hypothetical protein
MEWMLLAAVMLGLFFLFARRPRRPEMVLHYRPDPMLRLIPTNPHAGRTRAALDAATEVLR